MSQLKLMAPTPNTLSDIPLQFLQECVQIRSTIQSMATSYDILFKLLLTEVELR
jgi:hypothetical protein